MVSKPAFRSILSALSIARPRSYGATLQCSHVPKPSFNATVRFAHLAAQRNDTFARITDDDLKVFRNILNSEHALVTNPQDLEAYNNDWLKRFYGKSSLALKPKTTEQVSKILKYCNERCLSVVPQGGNTGLVGGSVPVHDEIVINLQSMNQIISFDEKSGVLICEAGCILQNVDNWLEERQHIFPLDLAAKGSCQIGGNIATAAGGIRFLRFGSMHSNVLGLEIVLADGTVINNLQQLQKDNTGYDIKQLFIGSEGTIGIITKAVVKCPRRPTAVNVAMLALNSYDDVMTALSRTRMGLQEVLSAFEIMDSSSQIFVKKHSGNAMPIDGEYPFYCLIETQGSNKDHDEEKLTTLLEALLEEGIVCDGVIAQDKKQITDLWALREDITECIIKETVVFKYDLSLPLPSYYAVVEATRSRLIEYDLISVDDETKPVIDVVSFGHIGDGNIHLNVVMRSRDDRVQDCMEPWLYEWVSQHNGSISGEHGLGLVKNRYLPFSKSPEMIYYMKKIKNLFDPKGILMPYKYFPNTDDPA